jgi:hypothetical protein
MIVNHFYMSLILRACFVFGLQLTTALMVGGQPPQRQFSLGTTRSFLPVNKLLIGQVGIEQIPQTTLWVDYNRTFRSAGKKLLWGLAAAVNYEKHFYTIDWPLPYFTPERDKFVFLAGEIKNVELFGYVGKRLDLYRYGHWKLALMARMGPVFHINPYPNYTEASSNLLDNGVAVFRLYEIVFTRPQWYVPYWRGIVSLELTRRFKSGLELGVAPMISAAALSQDEALFLTVPDDPIYRSLGTFRINRGFYGVNLIIGK